MRILALYSNKGGVGKTAASVNLSYLAAQSGLQTLVCDLDPQASTTFYFRVKPKLKRKAKGFVKGGKPIDNSIKGTDYENLDLLPADLSHRNLDIVFDGLKHSTRRLDKVMSPFEDEYDLIVLDCPPAINLVAENILNAADITLVPLIPTTLSVRTHEQLLAFSKKQGYDTNKIYTFFSMVDRRKKLHRDLVDTLQTEFANALCNPAIPYAADVEKMGIEREPVNAFAPHAAVSKAYEALWEEVRELLFPTK